MDFNQTWQESSLGVGDYKHWQESSFRRPRGSKLFIWYLMWPLTGGQIFCCWDVALSRAKSLNHAKFNRVTVPSYVENFVHGSSQIWGRGGGGGSIAFLIDDIPLAAP